MTVKMKKGQNVFLKEGNPALNEIMIGLGWDMKDGSRKKPKGDIDCDSSVFLLVNGRLESLRDIVFYNNCVHDSNSVKHMGDNRTGEGEGDDEIIFINLDFVPKKYTSIPVFVTIYMAKRREQDFGLISNAFIRIVDLKKDEEILKYNLTDDYSGMSAVFFGELVREKDGWKFVAVGDGTKDGSIEDIVKRYR